MKFITAIYNGLHHTEYGGRLNRDGHYLYSIRCLANMGAEIICYTSSADRASVQEYLDKHDLKNIVLREYDLAEMPYHGKIREIKEINKNLYAQDNVWAHRCVELMWLKIIWLYQESQRYPDEKVVWIDAGISHGGIIPKKFNSKNDLPGYENSFQHDKAFSGKLVAKLDKNTDDKVFAFYCNNRQHNYPDLFLNDPRLPGSICAGIFGGKAEQVRQLHTDFVEIIDYIISNNTLMQEEMMMTLIYQARPELFNTFDFDTWYHPDWDCYNPELKSFSEFFEDLL